VDYASHVALVAEVFLDGRETVIGEARYVRAADASLAEVSLSVAKLLQGKGLAKLMLTKLERHAAAAGVRRLFSETLATNQKVLSLAIKTGFAIAETADKDGVIRLEKTLGPRNQNPIGFTVKSTCILKNRENSPLNASIAPISEWSAPKRAGKRTASRR
jgi:RimJ/RimL family protein N-acetyltransferase